VRRTSTARGHGFGNDGSETGDSGDDESDVDLDSEEVFDDRQENPEPQSKKDASVADYLPRSMLPTRAGFYLCKSDVDTVSEALAAKISEMSYSTSKTFASDYAVLEERASVRRQFSREHTASAVYLSNAAQALKTEGYVVLDEILLGTSIAKDLDSVLNFFASQFGGAGVTAPRDPWTNIFNTGEEAADERAKAARVGRMSVNRKSLADDLEIDHCNLYQAKLRVELALALLMDCLGESPESLSVPCTGSRLLLTVGTSRADCPRQSPHVDYALPAGPGLAPWTARPNPSYFIIASGAQPFPLHVWPFSHILSSGGDEARVRAISRAVPSLRIQVGGHSVLIARGDLFHAGAAGDETNTSSPTNIRMHLYASREGSRLLDAVHTPRHCDFRFHE
jgi:hypothetical protein